MDPAPLEGHGGAGDDEGGQGGLRAASGLVGVLVGLVAVLWLLGLSRDVAGPDEDSGENPDAGGLVELPTTSSPIRNTAEQDPDEAPPATPGEPFSPLEGRLAYLSGNQVAVVDLATGSVTRLPIEVWGSIIPLADFELLTDGRRSVAVALDADPPSALLIASTAVLVPAAAAFVDYWVITRPDGPDGAIQLAAWQSYGYMSSWATAPAGSQLLPTGDSGLLVIPPVGRTFRPTIDGFEVVSDHRVLAANDGLRVEQRCDEQLACTVVAVVAESGPAEDLPESFVAELAEISVSADGRWLLNDTSPAWLFDRRTGELRLLEVGGYGQPRWSDDPALVAWLTTDRTPTLVVAAAEPGDIELVLAPVEPGDGGIGPFDLRQIVEPGALVVELAGLGADPSPGSSFLIDWELSPR